MTKKATSAFDIAANNGININPWGDLMFKTMNIQNQQYTPEEAQKTFDIIRGLPEYQAQQEGVSDMEAELDRLKRLPAVSGDTWMKPFLALVDSETGSNLSSAYQPNDVSQKVNEMILKYQDNLANRKKQSAETLMSGLGKFKSGTKTDVGGTDMTASKTGAQMSQTDANNQTKIDTSEISAAKKGSAKDKFDEVFKSEAAKKAVETSFAGQGSNMKQSATDLRAAADVIRKSKNKLISPSGSFGWARDMVANTFYEDVNAAKSTFSKEAVKSMADSFKGSMSDADRDMMIKSAYDSGADEEVNAKRAEVIAALFDKNAEKAEIFMELVASNMDPKDITKRMVDVDNMLNRKYGIGTNKTPNTQTQQTKSAAPAAPKKTFSSSELGF